MREERGLSRKAFGTAIGASEAKVQAIENGRQRVDHPILEALSRSLGIDANWLLLGDDNHHALTNASDFAPIRRYDVSASAGHGAHVDQEIGTGTYAFNKKWLDRRNLDPIMLSVIDVKGDSMEPELCNGDLILIDHSQVEPKDGSMFAVRYSDDLFVKRLQKLPEGHLKLVSTNTIYPAITINQGADDTITIIGRVVASMHEW